MTNFNASWYGRCCCRGNYTEESKGMFLFIPSYTCSWGYKADHSPPSRAEVKNEWSYTSAPSYVFTAWCLVTYRMSLCCGTSLSTGTTLPYLTLIIFDEEYKL
jgi:hypothetical protein